MSPFVQLLHRQLALAVAIATLISCTTYVMPNDAYPPDVTPGDACRPHDMIPTLQIPFPYNGSNGAVAPSCSIDDHGIVMLQYTPLSCTAELGWWGGCTVAANQDLEEFDAQSGEGRGVIAVKLCVKDFVPSALNLRYGSPPFAANGRTKFMPLITTGERFTGSGCRLVYVSPQDACYSFNRCGSASGCVAESTSDPGSICDPFTRSKLIVLNEFCVEPQAASSKPTIVTIEQMTYYPERCICHDTTDCAAPNVCRRDGWLSDSKCESAPGGCPGVCAP